METDELTPEPQKPEQAQKKPARKRRLLRFLLGAVAVVAVVIVVAVILSRTPEPPLLRADAAQLTSSLVTPHLEAPIQPGKNLLWCSTFQLAWNAGCKSAGGDLRLDIEPPIVPILNKKTASEADLAPECYVAMAGLAQDGIVAKIRSALQAHGFTEPELLGRLEKELPPDGWLAYAYLCRDLPFAVHFDRLKQPLAFGPAKVMSFGALERALTDVLDQVRVLAYTSDDDFIIKLAPQVEGEQIILAKVAPGETLGKTIEVARQRVASAADYELSHLFSNERLVVPVLNFDLLKSYDELNGKLITTAGPVAGMPIIEALQSIRFRLDERGAMLKSTGIFGAASAGVPRVEKPRQFIFDKPFLILLERNKAAQPYFALWVDNAELLAPFK